MGLYGSGASVCPQITLMSLEKQLTSLFGSPFQIRKTTEFTTLKLSLIKTKFRFLTLNMDLDDSDVSDFYFSDSDSEVESDTECEERQCTHNKCSHPTSRDWDPERTEIHQSGSKNDKIMKISEYIAHLVYTSFVSGSPWSRNSLPEKKLRKVFNLSSSEILVNCTPSARNYRKHDRHFSSESSFKDWIICVRIDEYNAYRRTLLKKVICLPEGNEEMRYEIIAHVRLILGSGLEYKPGIWRPWRGSPRRSSSFSHISTIRELIEANGCDGSTSPVKIAINLQRNDIASLLIKSGEPVAGLTLDCVKNHWQTLADIAIAINCKAFSKFLIMTRVQVCKFFYLT